MEQEEDKDNDAKLTESILKDKISSRPPSRKRPRVDNEDEIKRLKYELMQQQLANERIRYDEVKQRIKTLASEEIKNKAVTEYFQHKIYKECKDVSEKNSIEESDNYFYQNL